jgi:hypothetical protein
MSDLLWFFLKDQICRHRSPELLFCITPCWAPYLCLCCYSNPPCCCAAASRLVQARKPAGKLGGGLGVKKLEAKVDEGLFEQAPAAPEPVKPLPVAAAVQQEAEKPAASSRFAYDTLTAVSIVCVSSWGQDRKSGVMLLCLSFVACWLCRC